MSAVVERSGQIGTDQSEPLMLIDTDVHESLSSFSQLRPYIPEPWRDYATRACANFGPLVPAAFPYGNPTGTIRKDWEHEGEAAGGSLERLQEELMDGLGISIAILCGIYVPSAASANHELWAAMASAYNDWQIHEWLERDSRLRGSVHLVAHDPPAAAREIDRVAAHPQIVQVFLPLVNDRQYGDPMYRPIFEAALRNDLIVSFHHSAQTQTALGYPRYYIEWHTTAAPVTAINQITSLISNGLFDKYPELKVLFMETGVTWLPWLMTRFDQQYKEYHSEVPWVKRLPSEIMRANVRLSTQPMADTDPAGFKRIVEETGAQEIFMYSSDYPHYDADVPEVVLPASLPAELRRRVSYQNAVETFPRLAGLAMAR